MLLLYFFFFNDTATTEIYTLSLHDALPIYLDVQCVDAGGLVVVKYVQQRGPLLGRRLGAVGPVDVEVGGNPGAAEDRKSTRLNFSHANISYAVFCLKKKKINTIAQ